MRLVSFQSLLEEDHMGEAWDFKGVNARKERLDCWRYSKLLGMGACSPEDFSNLGSDLPFNSCFFLRYILINTKEIVSCLFYIFIDSVISKVQCLQKKRVKQWRHQNGFKQRARRLPFRRAETPNEYKAKDWSNHHDLVIKTFSGNNFFQISAVRMGYAPGSGSYRNVGVLEHSVSYDESLESSSLWSVIGDFYRDLRAICLRKIFSRSI